MKDFGDDKKILPKYRYLGGCLLVMTKETFNKVNGFNNNFGHDGSKLSANEDVLIQDIARKNDININPEDEEIIVSLKTSKVKKEPTTLPITNPSNNKTNKGQFK